MQQGLFMSALSLCRNTQKPLSIYILTATLGKQKALRQSFARKLSAALRDYNPKSKATLIDITEIFGDYLPVANMGTRFTPMCMLRLFADLVQEIPDKVLYLDTDVMCRRDFSSLYNAPVHHIELAGVPDRYGKRLFGNTLKQEYLNSGVLLLNMKRIRESGLFRKCREMCRDKRMLMPDQTALNKLAVKRKLPQKYNEQGSIKRDTVFKHFTTYFRFFPKFKAITIKPWNVERMHKELRIFEFDSIIYEYQRRISDD